MQIDKLLHAETNALIVIAGSIIHPILGITLAILASLGKELYDWFKYGRKYGWKSFCEDSKGDLIADFIGVIGGILIWWTLL